MNSNLIPEREEFIRGLGKFKEHEPRDAMYNVARHLLKEFWGKPSDMADGLGVLLLTWNQAFYRYGEFDFKSLEKCIGSNLQKIENFRNRDISSLSDSDKNDIKDLFVDFLKALQIDVIRFSDKNKKRNTKKDLENFLRKLGIVYDNSNNLKNLYNSIDDNQKIKSIVEFISKGKSNSKKDYAEVKISKLDDGDREILESLGLIRRSPVAVAKALHLLAPNFFPLWDDKIAQAPPYKCYYNKNPDEKYVSFCERTKTIADKVRTYIDQSDKTTLVKLIDEYNYSKYTKGWI